MRRIIAVISVMLIVAAMVASRKSFPLILDNKRYNTLYLHCKLTMQGKEQENNS